MKESVRFTELSDDVTCSLIETKQFNVQMEKKKSTILTWRIGRSADVSSELAASSRAVQVESFDLLK